MSAACPWSGASLNRPPTVFPNRTPPPARCHVGGVPLERRLPKPSTMAMASRYPLPYSQPERRLLQPSNRRTHMDATTAITIPAWHPAALLSQQAANYNANVALTGALIAEHAPASAALQPATALAQNRNRLGPPYGCIHPKTPKPETWNGNQRPTKPPAPWSSKYATDEGPFNRRQDHHQLLEYNRSPTFNVTRHPRNLAQAYNEPGTNTPPPPLVKDARGSIPSRQTKTR
ncbi:hypothetical protein WOLCODRAFT_157706 [Wolfiporia cocos MD-104 SS10]|uniref:Uncharacterized protein n=1 Tax=Wolfiporia cocos (strain MD-104) TaxID=742152 RepID=A0A2H3JH10_WOLCO|nr:hypothetical protein WOLCODRAFT_157706 [Wolfiporia cocos MD-104 SS10]